MMHLQKMLPPSLHTRIWSTESPAHSLCPLFAHIERNGVFIFAPLGIVCIGQKSGKDPTIY